MPGTPRGQPTVDVLISTFNEEAYIAECLDSVLCQDYPPELVQIWVIDGGSTDSTVSIVTARAAGEPRIRVIADGARMNLPEALNVGIEHSSGDLVAKIDARTFPARDFLTNAVAAFQSEDGSVACVGGGPEQHGGARVGPAPVLAPPAPFGVRGRGEA